MRRRNPHGQHHPRLILLCTDRLKSSFVQLYFAVNDHRAKILTVCCTNWPVFLLDMFRARHSLHKQPAEKKAWSENSIRFSSER